MNRKTSFLTAVAVFAADQLSKLLVRARVHEFDTIVVIPGCLNIVRSSNPGIAFGMFADSSATWTKLVLIGIGAIVMIIIGRLLWKSAKQGESRIAAALALILGGAAGNLLDRIVHGEVTDFIDFYVGSYHWYTFNLADAAITVAAALLLIDILSSRERVVSD